MINELRKIIDICKGHRSCASCPLYAPQWNCWYTCVFDVPPESWKDSMIEKIEKAVKGAESEDKE